MHLKLKHIISLATLILILSSFSNSSVKSLIMQTKKVQVINGAIAYQQNFKNYSYYIETIGTVSIDNVELKGGKLTAIYSYKSGNETRHVVSTLSLDKDNIYKGTCTTKVNGNILFSVNTWLTFDADGTATGNWSWSGAPAKNDPIVKISKL